MNLYGSLASFWTGLIVQTFPFIGIIAFSFSFLSFLFSTCFFFLRLGGRSLENCFNRPPQVSLCLLCPSYNSFFCFLCRPLNQGDISFFMFRYNNLNAPLVKIHRCTKIFTETIPIWLREYQSLWQGACNVWWNANNARNSGERSDSIMQSGAVEAKKMNALLTWICNSIGLRRTLC